MELFKLNSSFQQGQIIKDTTSTSWIERYRDAGEFTIEAPVSSGLRTFLPLDTFISHTDTPEVMIVENHEIKEDENSEAVITITGRSLETFLENRIVGSNRTFPYTGVTALPEYTLSSVRTHNQAVNLINDHILTAPLVQDNDFWPLVISAAASVFPAGASVERILKRDPVYKHLLDLLKIDDLGIKVYRGPVWNPALPTLTYLIIHPGEDKTNSIAFSYTNGDLASANYLWSNKTRKNSALITGKWLENRVQGSAIGYDRRMMLIDGSAFDTIYTAMPAAGATQNGIRAAMAVRANEILDTQKDVNIANVEISRTSSSYKYRKDYNVGDVVAVEGNYDASTKMRVIEYVEIEDENGQVGYPTLSAIES